MTSLISDFPVELLQRIFSFLPEIPPATPDSWKKKVEYALAPPLPPTTTNDKASRRGWINAAIVCRHWREIAFAMKRTVPIRLAPERAGKDLTRGVQTVFDPLPVILYVEQHLLEIYGLGHGRPQPQGPPTSLMLRLVNALGGRVKGIFVYLSATANRQTGTISMTAQLLRFLQYSIVSLPSLDELHLVSPGRNHRHGPKSTTYTVDGVLDVPESLLEGKKLRVLELRDCHFAASATVFAHTELRKLTLVAATDMWPLPPATNLKQLEYLCLTLESIPRQSTIVGMESVEMPLLRHLHLGGFMYNVGALLSKLSFPASTSIVLCCEYNANTVTEHICPLVAPLAEHLAGCAQGEGFTNVALRVKRLETEIVCSAPASHASGPLLAPSTSITISLACRLRSAPAELGSTYTTAIFEDLLTGICTRIPYADAANQTLEVTLPSPGSQGSAYAYWLEAASALRATTSVHVDGQAAQHLLEFIETRRAQRAEVPFPRLRRLVTLARHAQPDDVQKLHQLLRDEAAKRDADCVVPLTDVRVD